MADDADVRLIPGKEFTRIANALRVIDKKLPTQLRKELRQQVKPLMTKSKDKVRRLPTRGVGSTGLRRRVARGVGIRVGVGNRPYIRVVTRMANPKEAAIPRGLDGGKGWTHPTFGHDPTVTQNPQGKWFVPTFAAGKKDVQRGVVKVMDDFANYVHQHGK